MNNLRELIDWFPSGTAEGEKSILEEAFVYVDDFADAVLFFMNKNIKEAFINIGTGKDFRIEWYVKFIMQQLKVKLNIKYDKSKPDGVPRKLLDVSLAKKYGWKSKTLLKDGLSRTLKDFQLGYRA